MFNTLYIIIHYNTINIVIICIVVTDVKIFKQLMGNFIWLVFKMYTVFMIQEEDRLHYPNSYYNYPLIKICSHIHFSLYLNSEYY